MRNKRSIWTGLAAFAAGIVFMLLASNLSGGEKAIDEPLGGVSSTDDPQFRRELSVLLGPPFIEGNKAEVLLNGDAIFGAMLAGIRQASRTITFETYIYWSESIGREFADALIERARAGVKVHVLLDWIGSSKIEEAYLDQMVAGGVQVQRFHPPHWSHLPRLNNRTHRKLLVIDGLVGFTGGVGIADKWRGTAQDADHWRDTHFRVEGPVVAQFQSVFIDNWTKATGRVLRGADYFPPLVPRGAVTAQMFSSSPSGGSESMHLMYLMAIEAARSRIDLSSSYFVPDDLTVGLLADASRRGVQVRIIVPGTQIDSSIVRRASRARWGPLLQAGVRIWEYQPTMFHCKVLVVDGLLVSAGSTNFDNRSFRLNDEASLNVLDADFAALQTQIFEADLTRARQIDLQTWQQRPWHEKATEALASLLGPQL